MELVSYINSSLVSAFCCIIHSSSPHHLRLLRIVYPQRWRQGRQARRYMVSVWGAGLFSTRLKHGIHKSQVLVPLPFADCLYHCWIAGDCFSTLGMSDIQNGDLISYSSALMYSQREAPPIQLLTF